MFFMVNFWEKLPDFHSTKQGKHLGHVIIETANIDRCQQWMDQEMLQRPGRLLFSEWLDRVADSSDLPPDYRYIKRQMWVDGDDPGWCRLWVKGGTILEVAV